MTAVTRKANGQYLPGANKTHGGRKTPEYRCWTAMNTRCFNRNNAAFQAYGGRGISVCDRWSDFAMFLADMGPRPSLHHSIDRIDNDGDYEPANCRWATQAEQNRNTSVALRFIALDGTRMSGMDMARFLAIPRSTFFRLWATVSA
jgi:hypothetical protein